MFKITVAKSQWANFGGASKTATAETKRCANASRSAVAPRGLVPGRLARPGSINLCRRSGKARAFATGELERDLSWWLGKNVDANLILRTYAAINLLHGDIVPPPSGAKAAERNAWVELVDSLPPVGHFHKAWSQLVERVDDGTEERWVLLPGRHRPIRRLAGNQRRHWKAICRMFMDFDRVHHPEVLAGGLWLNCGFAGHGKLRDWEVSIQDVRVHSKQAVA